MAIKTASKCPLNSTTIYYCSNKLLNQQEASDDLGDDEANEPNKEIKLYTQIT